MGGADTKSEQQSQSVTQLPPWINDAAQQNYAFAQNVANRPLQQYQGQMVADVGPQMQQAWNLAANSGNVGKDQYDASQAGYMGVLGQQPQQVTAGQLSNTNLSPYMNPYTQNVINATLPIMQQQLGLQQGAGAAAAAGAGAFGGSRQGVQAGVTQAQGAQNMAQMAQQLNQANFTQAQAAAQQDIASRMQAALANQGVQQNQAGLNLQAAGGLAGLGNAAQANQVRNFTELATAGGMQQQQAQNQINAQMQKYNQAWQYPTQQLGALQSALGMTPYGTATQGMQTTETQQSANPFQMAVGGLGSLTSLFGSGGLNLLGGLGGALKASKGMTKVPGFGLGDHVPALLEPGEAVLSRHAAAKIGRGKIASLNKSAPLTAPGAISGGVHPPALNAMPRALRGMLPSVAPAPQGIGGAPPGGAPLGIASGAMPGPLASPVAAGGPLGGTIVPPVSLNRKRIRPPQLRGALGG